MGTQKTKKKKAEPFDAVAANARLPARFRMNAQELRRIEFLDLKFQQAEFYRDRIRRIALEYAEPPSNETLAFLLGMDSSNVEVVQTRKYAETSGAWGTTATPPADEEDLILEAAAGVPDSFKAEYEELVAAGFAPPILPPPHYERFIECRRARQAGTTAVVLKGARAYSFAASKEEERSPARILENIVPKSYYEDVLLQ